MKYSDSSLPRLVTDKYMLLYIYIYIFKQMFIYLSILGYDGSLLLHTGFL